MSISSRKKWAPAIAGAVVLALGAAGVAQAQGSKDAEAAIKYRQSLYTVIGNNFGPLGAMATGKAPFDAVLFQRNAARVAFLSTIAPEVFPAISRSGAPTKAKPAIWTNKAEFDRLMKDFQDKTAALATASKSGTLEGVKAAFGAAGSACKACHDKFRAD